MELISILPITVDMLQEVRIGKIINYFIKNLSSNIQKFESVKNDLGLIVKDEQS